MRHGAKETLYGRDAEQTAVSRLISAARDGQSGVLVLHGEAGIGKTALLEYTQRRADGFTVLRVAAAEHEAQVAFSALQLLLAPALDRLDRLPEAQATALGRVLGKTTEQAVADRFLIGLAVLSVLAEGDGPLLCLVDDAQWLDEASAEALAFAARRLDAEGVALVITARDGAWPARATGLSALRLRRLDDEAATALLTARVRGLAPEVRRRIIEGAEGNPLALLELPAMLTAEQRAGRLGALLFDGGATPPAGRVQQAFLARIQDLPEPTRDLLLVAAADDTGRLAPVLAAAGRLGRTVADLGPAERSELVHVQDDRLVFRHPLVRAASYQAATYAQRVAAHGSLAEVLTGAEHADRRAWHLAAAAPAADERAAGELERAGSRARDRQAPSAASAAFERAAQLTGDDLGRARLLLAAAETALPAGQLTRAAALAKAAAELETDVAIRAGLARIRSAVEFEQGSPGTAGRMLVEAAGSVSADDPDGATVLLMTAVRYASFGGDAKLAWDARTGLTAVGPLASAPLRAMARGLAAMADLLTGEFAADVGALRTAVQVGAGPDAPWDARLLAASFSLMTGDMGTAEELSAAVVTICRDTGLFGVLPQALILHAQAQVGRGRHHEARASAAEAYRVALDLDQRHRVGQISGILAWLAAVAGDEAGCRQPAMYAIEQGRSGGIVTSQALGHAALGLLDLGLGRPEPALEQLEQTSSHPVAGVYYTADLVEAAVRCGKPERAAEPMARLERWSEHTGHIWLRAMAARCRALLAEGSQAEARYALAIRLHEESDQPFEKARTELLLGERLRRGRRRSPARVHLRSALATFEQLGAQPWAARARAELSASGQIVGGEPATCDPLAGLTPQERQVIRLAATGATSREIAARLFLSPRTVEHHLYKAFPKLGITSRAGLADLTISPAAEPR